MHSLFWFTNNNNNNGLKGNNNSGVRSASSGANSVSSNNNNNGSSQRSNLNHANNNNSNPTNDINANSKGNHHHQQQQISLKANARLFMDHFFLTWLARPETIAFIEAECKKGGFLNDQRELLSKATANKKKTNHDESSSGMTHNNDDKVLLASLDPNQNQASNSNPSIGVNNNNNTNSVGLISSLHSTAVDVNNNSTGMASGISFNNNTTASSSPSTLNLTSTNSSSIPPVSPKLRSRRISSSGSTNSGNSPSLSPLAITPIMSSLSLGLDEEYSAPAPIPSEEDSSTHGNSNPMVRIEESLEQTPVVSSSSFNNNNSNSNTNLPPVPLSSKDSALTLPPSSSSTSTPSSTSDRQIALPRFYFPHGNPISRVEERRKRHTLLNVVRDFFGPDAETGITEENFVPITRRCGLPRFLNTAFFRKIDVKDRKRVNFAQFARYWKNLSQNYFDDFSRSFNILKSTTASEDQGESSSSTKSSSSSSGYLLAEDFLPVLEDVILHHPGLQFLSSLPLFQERYVETVICRIFYSMNRNWCDRISLSDFRKSRFLYVVRALEETEDINYCRDFFSYTHFYVIYCKFWELDTDHDLLIDFEALTRYDNYALSSRIVERVMMGCGHGRSISNNANSNNINGNNRGTAAKRDFKRKPNSESTCLSDLKMTYRDFIWFIISEQDKSTTTSIEYWFRCMDLDGDGIISMYEMQYFYEEQLAPVEDGISFADCLCQVFDLVKPKEKNMIRLADLKRCNMAPVFFDLFFNLGKYIAYEQRESSHQSNSCSPGDYDFPQHRPMPPPFANRQQNDLSDFGWIFALPHSRWDKYADAEYREMAEDDEEEEEEEEEVVEEEEAVSAAQDLQCRESNLFLGSSSLMLSNGPGLSCSSLLNSNISSDSSPRPSRHSSLLFETDLPSTSSNSRVNAEDEESARSKGSISLTKTTISTTTTTTTMKSSKNTSTFNISSGSLLVVGTSSSSSTTTTSPATNSRKDDDNFEGLRVNRKFGSTTPPISLSPKSSTILGFEAATASVGGKDLTSL